MCEELKLIQTHLGIWKLEDWTIPVCSTQLNGKLGIYCIKNLINDKLLIGEGKISERLKQHINSHANNQIFKQDVKRYGQDNFRLIWTISEEDEIQRKLIENRLQLYFSENCYNRARRKYPTQKELLEDKYISGIKNGTIIERLNNYAKAQRDYIDECWESKYSVSSQDKCPYSRIFLKNKNYLHHVLMYILHYGDICGITSTIHHKCENKKCVNPEHLELVTHTKNVILSSGTADRKDKINKLHKEGLSTIQIANKLSICKSTVRNHINFKNTSNYLGVSWNIDKTAYQTKIKFMNTNSLHLGYYNNEIEAAQNRDYFIVKKNLLVEPYMSLNFHNIDYNNYIPKPTRDGKINKNLL